MLVRKIVLSFCFITLPLFVFPFLAVCHLIRSTIIYIHDKKQSKISIVLTDSFLVSKKISVCVQNRQMDEQNWDGGGMFCIILVV